MSLLIDNILAKHKITDYLAKKGIHPDGVERNGKLFYRCPLHDGDNTPSFVVYTQSGDYENYYCFGCKSKYNILHLFRELEKVSMRETIALLGDGIVPTDEAEISHAIRQITSDSSLSAKYTPDDLSLEISRLIH